MFSPAASRYERPVAHGSTLLCRTLSRRENPVMVILPTTVPSCFYPVGTHKTCYPSPLRRSAGLPNRPPFFALVQAREIRTYPQGVSCVGLRARGKSTGDASQCAPSFPSPPFSRPSWPSRAAYRPILNAPVSALSSGASEPPLSADRLRPAWLSAQPQARSATTSTCADIARGAARPVTSEFEGHPGADCAGVAFFASTGVKTRKEGT